MHMTLYEVWSQNSGGPITTPSDHQNNSNNHISFLGKKKNFFFRVRANYRSSSLHDKMSMCLIMRNGLPVITPLNILGVGNRGQSFMSSPTSNQVVVLIQQICHFNREFTQQLQETFLSSCSRTKTVLSEFYNTQAFLHGASILHTGHDQLYTGASEGMCTKCTL